MAAGRHGGYRDNEFRDRGSNFEVPKRGLGSAKQEFDQDRNTNRDSESSRVQELRSRGEVRHRDIKEREVVNGDTHSSSRSNSSNSSGGGDPGRRGGQFPIRITDREPGELSSESGSDDAIESNLQVKERKGMNVLANGRSPVVTKRKFSPIIWDIDDVARSSSLKRRFNATVTALPPPPLLPKVYRESPNVIPDGGVIISPVRIKVNEELQSSLSVQSPESPGLDVGLISESPVRMSSISPKQFLDINLEAEHVEDEDYVPTRNISSSRWAAGNNSPGDEDEIFESDVKRKLKVSHSEPLDIRVRGKSISPEDVELKKRSSEATRVRSSDSDDLPHSARSISRDDNPGNESGREDDMDVDEEDHKNRADASQSNTDSDYENDPRVTPERSVPQRNVNMLQSCRSVDEFERLNKIDEGTYGVVYRAKDKKTGEIVALKKVKMEKEREGFPLTSLREINILLSFHHPSIVDVKEVVVGSSLDSIFMVMEYMEHDLKGLMETMKQPYSQSEVKCLMIQLLEGIKYLHDNWVLHRDLKTSNLLLNNRGELKICDFGLARQYGSPLKPYTHLVVTLWYRAPELLLGAKQYSTAIDMWSLGCIMAELLSKEPLFNGKTEVDQLDKIFRTLGTPNETIWPKFAKLPGVRVNFVKHQYNLLRKKFPATSFTGSHVLSDSGFDLLNKLLTYDPEKRITAGDALKHEWFREVPLPKSKEFMPTFPAQHAQDRRMRRVMKSPDPLEEQRRKELKLKELGAAGLFG